VIQWRGEGYRLPQVMNEARDVEHGSRNIRYFVCIPWQCIHKRMQARGNLIFLHKFDEDMFVCTRNLPGASSNGGRASIRYAKYRRGLSARHLLSGPRSHLA
jgi:hypothetical protein